MDVAAYGTNANIERTRQTAIAVSIRFNHLNGRGRLRPRDEAASSGAAQ
jgi:hypothetical protein